jgi:hypothetical protein
MIGGFGETAMAVRPTRSGVEIQSIFEGWSTAQRT